MRSTQLTFRGRIRAALMAGGASFVLAAGALSGTALAADQPAQTAQATDQIGPHTHQLHGLVDATPAAGATSFTLDTERYGKVTVTFSGRTRRGNGHDRGKARSFEASDASALKAGERVVVQGRTSSDGKTFVARRVHVLPEKGAAKANHVVGTVASVATANGTSTLSIKLADGTTQSVTVSSETKLRPEGKTLADLTAGTKVTVVTRNGVATGIQITPS